MASDAEDVEKIRETRSNYVQQLLDLSDPTKKKLTYSIGGRTVSWTEYRKFLREEIASLNSLIAGMDPADPGEVITAIE